jgi:hypothetical protein
LTSHRYVAVMQTKREPAPCVSRKYSDANRQKHMDQGRDVILETAEYQVHGEQCTSVVRRRVWCSFCSRIRSGVALYTLLAHALGTPREYGAETAFGSHEDPLSASVTRA